MVSRRLPRSLPALSVIAAFVVSRVYLLLFHLHTGTNLKEYWGWLSAAAAGRRPFIDFPIEYPPLAWWVMQLPATLDRPSYYFRFRLLMGACDVLSFVLLWSIARRRRPQAAVLVAGVYVAVTVILEFVLYDTLDLLMLCLLLIACRAWLQATEPARSAGWRWLAYAAVGLGASYKVIPGLALPFLILGDLRSTRRWTNAGAGLAIFALAAAVPIAVSYASAGPAALGFVRYHIDRGIEIESTWATLMWLSAVVAPPVSVAERFGSWELSGPAARVFLTASTMASIAVLCSLAWWAVRLKERFQIARSYLHALLTLLGMLLVSKVFSEQYLLWSIPITMLAAIEVTTDGQSLAAIGAASIAMAAITTGVFPLGMPYVAQLNPWIMGALALRNLVYAAVVIWLFRRAWASDADRSHSEARGSTSSPRANATS